MGMDQRCSRMLSMIAEDESLAFFLVKIVALFICRQDQDDVIKRKRVDVFFMIGRMDNYLVSICDRKFIANHSHLPPLFIEFPAPQTQNLPPGSNVMSFLKMN